jgi:hypothetical protein
MKREREKSTVRKHLNIQKKRANTLKYNNSFILKGFKRFLTSGSYGFSLEAEHLDNMFATTHPWSKYSKPRRISNLDLSNKIIGIPENF